MRRKAQAFQTHTFMYCVSLTGFHIEEELEEKKTTECNYFHRENQCSKAHQTYSMSSYIIPHAYLFCDSSSHLLAVEYFETPAV